MKLTNYKSSKNPYDFKKVQIDICCSSMYSAIRKGSVILPDYMNVPDRTGKLVIMNIMQHDGHFEMEIYFCPFCKNRIEIIDKSFIEQETVDLINFSNTESPNDFNHDHIVIWDGDGHIIPAWVIDLGHNEDVTAYVWLPAHIESIDQIYELKPNLKGLSIFERKIKNGKILSFVH